jgi:hypothetical protein
MCPITNCGSQETVEYHGVGIGSPTVACAVAYSLLALFCVAVAALSLPL